MEREVLAASNFSQLIEILQQHETETQNIVHTITYNPQSQTIIIKMRDLLNREADSMGEIHAFASAPVKLTEAEELKRLSKFFTSKFPELANSFRSWEPHRVSLIKKSEAAANKLDWNVLLGSMSRIFTSTADLVATWMRLQGSERSLVQLTLENAPLVSFLSLFIQATVSSQVLNNIRTSVKKDQELFKPIKAWFQQSQELDTAVRNYFPYGIDPRIVAEIEHSAKIPDESSRIFMSVIATNVKNNLGLLNKDFFGKAEMFSTSEAGVKWYRKILFEMDPLYIECLKCDLENQIKELKSSHTISDPEKIAYSTLPLQNHLAKFKILFNGMSIFSSVCSIWDEKSNKNAETLKELSEKAKDELVAMKKVYDLLKPSND